jgi:hypothetical protein
MRSTQLERYSRSPGQHDLSVQTRRLKRPLMAKVWLPKLWASTIPSICTCGRSNSGQVARTYGPGDASYADKSEIRQIMFQGCFRILSSFPRKPINTKVGDNFVAHNMDTEFALFGVRTWEYGVSKEGLWIREIWTRLILWKSSSLLSQGRSGACQGGAHPKAPLGYEYNP